MDDLVKRAPVKYRNLYGKALQGKLAPRSAIKIKCLECCGWERMRDGIDLIGGCSIRSCPLWAVRPFQAKRVKVDA